MRTATRSWPTPAARFVLFGIAASLGVFVLLRLSWVEAHALLPFTLAQGAVAVRLFGAPSLPIDVTLACSGADAVALCLGAILAYPASWRRRLAGAAGGLGLIVALNILRIGTLGRAAASPRVFDALHLYILPAVLTLAIAGYVLLWMRPAKSAEVSVDRTAPQLPRISAKFVLFAAAFLLLFIAAAPLYVNNAVLLAVAAFVARSAARILTFAGVQSSAAGNILWGPNGGFLVTVECIVTPLIPVYLAAIAAYASNWKQRSLALAATAPVFIALGVIRLLIVAFPNSAETQAFFVHAFYQLLIAAAIIFGAAFWRHRDRSSFPFGAGGVLTGVLFVAIAGPLYLRLITAVSGLPASDPQGAIGFLPAFQTGLFLALSVAAWPGRWRGSLTGLAILVAAQIAVLLVVNRLSGLDTWLALAAVTTAVRAWALAAPVLVFAAVVFIGRPRR